MNKPFFVKMNNNICGNPCYDNFCQDCLTRYKNYKVLHKEYHKRKNDILNKPNPTKEDFDFYFNSDPPRY